LSFVTCKQCGKEWAERDDFFADPAVVLSGCQVETERPVSSALLFDHQVAGCGTTIALGIRQLDDLYTGPRHKVDWAPSAKCHGMCFDPRNLDVCPAECRSAYVRQILREVRKLSGA
jgi:hypothetical protein